jgi:hypothetical protein
MFLEVAYPTKTTTKTTGAAPPPPDYQHEMQPHWKKTCPPGNPDAKCTPPGNLRRFVFNIFYTF